MRPYWAVFRTRFRLLLQYRGAALAGLATQIFWGLLRVMIFGAFLASATGPHPLTKEQIITYIWLGQALLATLPWNLEPEVAASVRSGAVAYELVRPIRLWSLWFARHVAYRTAPALLRAVPMVVLAMLCFDMKPPAGVISATAFAASVLMAILLSAAISTLMAVSLLWTVAGEGVVLMVAAIVVLCSGLALPLPFYPDWLQPLLDWLPFRGLMDVPYRLYMGHIPASQALGCLVHQVTWTIAISAAGALLAGRGLKRLVVQGG